MATSLIIMGAGGRMGSTLVRLANEQSDFEICALIEPNAEKISSVPKNCLISSSLEDVITKCQDAVIIDFTAPVVSIETARLAAKHKNPVVIGTTGLSAEQKLELEELAKETIIVFSPNMSVGINVLLDILPRLTALLGEDYDTDLMEIHHNLKKDAPSGTALRLAEAVAEGKEKDLQDVACYHREGIIGERPKHEIGLQTLRGGDVVGVHTVYYFGPGERIEITHQAHSRDNFAGGALRAARWVNSQKPGQLFTMRHVLAKN